MPVKKAKKRKVFSLKAPKATAVCLAGTFNDWEPGARLLKLGSDGVWKTSMTLTPGVHEYRFIVDGKWCDDPKCEDRRTNEFGSTNCVVRL